jgi:PAS domain S-box-containing protein
MNVTDPMQILETIHDGFFLLDVENDEILDANEQACELLGYDREQLLGLNVSAVHPDEMDRMREFASQAESGGSALASDFHCLRKDGRKIPVEASACHAEFGEGSGLAVTVRDISTAQRQNHYLEVFERVLRHNLRNRMNVVLSRAELIEQQATDDRVAEQSKILCETVDQLVEVLEDIRTVQQSLRTDVNASCRVDCTRALDDIVTEVETAHPNATVTTSLPGSLYVRSDDRLILALEHLVENAVLHNEKEHPNVEIVASPVKTYGYAEIKIIDDGPGIPSAERLVVTNPQQTSPLEHGTGLGLWVAAMIVYTIDGDITIADNEPDGTIVTVQLPSASAPAGSRSARS